MNPRSILLNFFPQYISEYLKKLAFNFLRFYCICTFCIDKQLMLRWVIADALLARALAVCIQPKPMKNYEFSGRNYVKSLNWITFCYKIFVPSSQFQWDFWQKNEQIPQYLARISIPATVNVLNLTTIFLPKRLRQKCRPRSDCFWRSSLIRVFSVCYSDMHFVNFSPENQLFLY